MIDPQLAALVIVALLGLTTALAWVHSRAALLAERDAVRSRAQIVREMKQIRMHRPRHVVDVDGMDPEFWGDR